MPDIKRNVKVSKKEVTNRLPDSFVEGGFVVEYLFSQGALHKVSQLLQVRRQGGYVVVDIFVFLTLFFSDRSREGGGMAGFSARCRPYRQLLGALAERLTLATSTSVSRFLGVVEPGSLEPLKDYLFLEASGARELLRRRSVRSRDSRGFSWDIFDLDPTSIILRQRALPDRKGMPKAVRRSKEAAPGYNGRKRGEVKVTRTTLQHADSGLWMGMWVAPGNGDFPHHRRLAFSRVKAVCESIGRDTSHVLVRMDGEGGNTPTITDCMEQGLHYLARSSFYAVLSHDEVRSYLNETSWYEVEDSGSGPLRYAAELGRFELPCSDRSQREDGRPYTPVKSRLVVSRYKAENKRGAGILIDGWKYEIFATDLDVQAYVANEVVTLYYGRSGEENCYKQEDRELQLDRALSYHLPGYELTCAIGLFLWNLWLCWGARLFGTAEVLPEQVARRLIASKEDVTLPVDVKGSEVEESRTTEPLCEPAGSSAGTGERSLEQGAGLQEDGVSNRKQKGEGCVSTPEEPVTSESCSTLSGETLPEVAMVVEAHADDGAKEKDEEDVTNLLELVDMAPIEPHADPDPTEEGTERATDVPQEVTPPIEEARRVLNSALARLDWTRLRQHAQGWRFSEQDGGIRCSHGHLLTLRSVQLLPGGSTGVLRFRALPGRCPACPGRPSCGRPDSRSRARELNLRVSGAEAHNIKVLLARTRGQPTSEQTVPSETVRPSVGPASPEGKASAAGGKASEAGSDAVDHHPLVLSESQASQEEARQKLNAALARVDWTGLRKQAQGWRFSEQDGGIRCPYGQLLTLRYVQLYQGRNKGALRFRALPGSCLDCPGRSLCIRSTSSARAHELAFVVPEAAALSIKVLLAMTRNESVDSLQLKDRTVPSPLQRPPPSRRRVATSTWERPEGPPKGAFLTPVRGSLQPAAARHRFHEASWNVDFYIEITLPETFSPPPPPSPLYAPSPESRQHRRLSWTRRGRLNALPRGSSVELDIRCPIPSKCALDFAPLLQSGFV